jgi:hypothetical protein
MYCNSSQNMWEDLHSFVLSSAYSMGKAAPTRQHSTCNSSHRPLREFCALLQPHDIHLSFFTRKRMGRGGNPVVFKSRLRCSKHCYGGFSHKAGAQNRNARCSRCSCQNKQTHRESALTLRAPASHHSPAEEGWADTPPPSKPCHSKQRHCKRTAVCCAGPRRDGTI